MTQHSLIKAAMQIYYSPSAHACAFAVENGPPLTLSMWAHFAAIKKIGMPQLVQAVRQKLQIHEELFAMFPNDYTLFYILSLICLFAPHKYLHEEPIFYSLLHLHAKYMQLLKQYIKCKYVERTAASNASTSSVSSQEDVSPSELRARTNRSHQRVVSHLGVATLGSLGSVRSGSVSKEDGRLGDGEHSDREHSDHERASEHEHSTEQDGLYTMLDYVTTRLALLAKVSEPHLREAAKKLASLQLFTPLLLELFETDVEFAFGSDSDRVIHSDI